MSTAEEKIAKMYDSQLAAQKEQLAQNYETAGSDLDAQQEAAKKQTQKNINLTKVEAQQATMNDAEYHAASGLSSGARAQARLARDNQLQSDVTALRAAQQEVDAEVERQRGLLAKEYTSAIREAQAENDLAKAQALYEQAEKEEAALLASQQAQAEALLAAQEAEQERKLEAAKYLAEQTGDFSAIAEIYGYTDEQQKKLGGGEDYNRNYETDASGKPEGLTGHGLLTSTGDSAEIKVTTNAGKTDTTLVPVMQAEDGTLWYWDHMQHKYLSFTVSEAQAGGGTSRNSMVLGGGTYHGRTAELA